MVGQLTDWLRSTPSDGPLQSEVHGTKTNKKHFQEKNVTKKNTRRGFDIGWYCRRYSSGEPAAGSVVVEFNVASSSSLLFFQFSSCFWHPTCTCSSLERPVISKIHPVSPRFTNPIFIAPWVQPSFRLSTFIRVIHLEKGCTMVLSSCVSLRKQRAATARAGSAQLHVGGGGGGVFM